MVPVVSLLSEVSVGVVTAGVVTAGVVGWVVVFFDEHPAPISPTNSKSATILPGLDGIASPLKIADRTHCYYVRNGQVALRGWSHDRRA
jgi:hypothetical protein